jgi:uncharacterized membrane protein
MSPAGAFAIILIFALWAGYEPIQKLFGRGSINSQLHTVRQHWMNTLQSMPREHRVFDGILFGHIMNSISFFGSATLIVLAGLVGTLVNVRSVHQAMSGLAFVAPVSVEVFAVNVMVIVVILGLSFFAFTYAQRKLAYTLALVGGLREAPGKAPECAPMIAATATVLTEAVKSINNGIRGFYYAIAALFLFSGPYICIAMTLVITSVIYYRQQFSITAKAIENYVEAMNGKTRG